MTSPSDLPGQPDFPYLVTYDRLVAVAGAQRLVVRPVGGDTLRGRWPDSILDLSVRSGDVVVVQVRGTAPVRVPAGRVGDVVMFANDWHRGHIWPVVHWIADDDGSVLVRTAFAVDVTAGASDAQLADALGIGIATANQCFRALAERLAAAPSP